MKRCFVVLMVLMASMVASAYTCVTFNSGDPSILMKEVSISYEIVWDNARVTNYDDLLFPQYLKKRGDDFVSDWPKDRKQAEKYFTVRFNKKSDYMRIVDNSTATDYKMTVRIATIDTGNGASSFNPWASTKAGGVIINGTIEFSNRQGEVVCVLNIVEAKGTGMPSETLRYGMCLSEIAGDIWDFVEDNVEDGKIQATPVSLPQGTSKRTQGSAGKKSSAAAKETTPAAAKEGTTSTAAPMGEARVTLKNGSVIVGKVKAFEPTSSITLFVAGITTTINMSDVASVESVEGKKK